MAIYGNLPPSSQQNATNNFFSNQNTGTPSVSPNVNDAIVGYFQQITGDVDTGKTLAAAVIYTSLQQNIDPMTIVQELKTLSDANRANSPTYANYVSQDQTDPNAKPGPSTVYSNLSQVSAYLTMFLNLNRNGTSLLGLSNSPQTSSYITRAVLP